MRKCFESRKKSAQYSPLPLLLEPFATSRIFHPKLTLTCHCPIYRDEQNQMINKLASLLCSTICCRYYILIEFSKKWHTRAHHWLFRGAISRELKTNGVCTNLKCTRLLHPMSRMTTNNLSEHLAMKSFLNALKIMFGLSKNVPSCCDLK